MEALVREIHWSDTKAINFWSKVFHLLHFKEKNRFKILIIKDR